MRGFGIFQNILAHPFCILVLAFTFTEHREIIVQLDYNSGHIGNPFSPFFYPHRSEYTAPFYLMWPRINNQTILDPL